MKKFLMLGTLMLSVPSWAQFSMSSDATTQVTNQIVINDKSFIVSWIVSIPTASFAYAADKQCKNQIYQAIVNEIRIEAEASDLGAISSSVVSECLGEKRVEFYAEPKVIVAE